MYNLRRYVKCLIFPKLHKYTPDLGMCTRLLSDKQAETIILACVVSFIYRKIVKCCATLRTSQNSACRQYNRQQLTLVYNIHQYGQRRRQMLIVMLVSCASASEDAYDSSDKHFVLQISPVSFNSEIHLDTCSQTVGLAEQYIIFFGVTNKF